MNDPVTVVNPINTGRALNRRFFLIQVDQSVLDIPMKYLADIN